jgi:hypothetical protein
MVLLKRLIWLLDFVFLVDGAIADDDTHYFDLQPGKAAA